MRLWRRALRGLEHHLGHGGWNCLWWFGSSIKRALPSMDPNIFRVELRVSFFLSNWKSSSRLVTFWMPIIDRWSVLGACAQKFYLFGVLIFLTLSFWLTQGHRSMICAAICCVFSSNKKFGQLESHIGFRWSIADRYLGLPFLAGALTVSIRKSSTQWSEINPAGLPNNPHSFLHRGHPRPLQFLRFLVGTSGEGYSEAQDED